MPLYLMMVIDGNGQSEIVAMFLTLVETKRAITNMICLFKEVNPAWQRVGLLSWIKILLNVLYSVNNFLDPLWSYLYFM